ncbi:4-alpha-glucanotransferase [Desulfobacterota bacterium M19]
MHKATNFIPRRGSGILLHISSLPGPYGIGDLGSAAYNFVDFLSRAGQSFWQFLPLCPSETSLGCSPYMGLASMAGNPLFISLDKLCDEGWLTMDDLKEAGHLNLSEYQVDYETVGKLHDNLLHRAFQRFMADDTAGKQLKKFSTQTSWLDDYALFMAIRDEEHKQPWNKWPAAIARRLPAAVREYRKRLAEHLDYFRFEQLCFQRQWQSLKTYANGKGVSLIGDLPFYVGLDSVDVWAHQDCFELDDQAQPLYTAGVPPDYFSATGQHWGNPIYRWQTDKQRKNKNLYTWWQRRFTEMSKMVNLTRIDHFRGFASYWRIPAAETTAINGRWLKGPGQPFFKKIRASLKDLTIIAEDLGIITPDVISLRDSLGLPGMKILQFAFDSDEKNLYLPHNFETTNCVVYTGTHDNNTTLGWYMGQASEGARKRLRRYANILDEDRIHWHMLRLALSSTAILAITPLQDILGFGEDCRMNTPGSPDNNWRWRCAGRFINDNIALKLRSETEFYGRI